MLRIERKTGKKGAEKWASHRGPFLTNAQVFDAGHRLLVVTLRGEFIEFRQRGRRRGVLTLDYTAAYAYALKRQLLERAKAKKAGKVVQRGA